MRLSSRLNPLVENKLKDAYFVGRLVNDTELAVTLMDKPIRYLGENNEEIQFYIKCLSPIPNEVSSHFLYPNNILTGNTRSKKNIKIFNELINYQNLFFYERLDKVKELLENKLIVFQLDPKPEFLYVDIVKIENIEPKSKYAIIPGPFLKSDETVIDFERKLVKKNLPIVLKNYPNIFDTPEFLYLDGMIYSVSLNKTNNPATYTQSESGEVKYLKDDKIAEIVDVRIDSDLYFIPFDELLNLRDKIYDSGKDLLERVISENVLEEDDDDEMKNDQQENGQPVAAGVFDKDEIEFLDRLINKANLQYHLYYTKQDIYSFHVSAKTNMLTIIGGMSGTGKTQLAKIYGETLGLEFGKSLKIIPISPSYQEPNDILGFLNPSTGIYHESETGLVSLLLEAERHPDRLYMVIFDEMNLSQVEHWFSPFISLLELDEDERYLTIFNEKDRCINEYYKPRIKINNNIIFVGTVNFDETTKSFSDRLLDRANVIYPKKIKFADIKRDYKSNEKGKFIKSLNVVAKAYRKNWINTNFNDPFEVLTEDELSLLDDIHELLQSFDKQKGVSFRTINGIANFIKNIPIDKNDQGLISRREAFDLQVLQRILSKIKGIDTFVRPIIGIYHSEEEYETGKLLEILQSEKAKRVSDFTQSIEVIKQKAKELMVYGYVQ